MWLVTASKQSLPKLGLEPANPRIAQLLGAELRQSTGSIPSTEKERVKCTVCELHLHEALLKNKNSTTTSSNLFYPCSSSFPVPAGHKDTRPLAFPFPGLVE